MIGGARIDENGKAHGGAAGDQTGREVCTQAWYNGGWNVVLRAKQAKTREIMAEACETLCKSNLVGYDQWQRNDLYDELEAVDWQPSKLTHKTETDCSAFITALAKVAGISVQRIYIGSGKYNAPVTQTMKALFLQTGAFTALVDSKYLTSDNYLLRGDILLRESGHVVLNLTNGQFSTASTGKQATGETTYTIKANDTLWGISREHDIQLADLLAANHISENSLILPGQILKIPGK